MRAGPLDRRVTLQRRALAQDVYGGEVETWAPLATVWAQRTDARGSERFKAGAERGEAETVYRIRWRSDVKAEDRLVEGDEIWDIVGVATLGRKDGVELAAKRAQA